MLDFQNSTITFPNQLQGRIDGENALKDGEGFMFSKMDEWRDSKDLQTEFPRIGDYIREQVAVQAKTHE